MDIRTLEDLGNTIMYARVRARRSQGDVAQRVGIHSDTLCRIERGNRFPRGETLFKLFAELGLDWQLTVRD